MSEFSFFSPVPALADVVETIWDLDLPDAAYARAMSIHVLPGVSPTLCLHYRSAPVSNQLINAGNFHQGMTGVQTRAVAIRPTGPVGAVMVRFKPEAAYRFPGCDMRQFTDANIRLSDLVSPAAAILLDESLKEAAGPIERVARVQAFLLQHLSSNMRDPLVHHAVMWLCGKPNSPVKQLAARLNISQRQLSRRFRLLTGITLKQFAQITRFSQAILARRRGSNWTESAHEAGFTDQAHLSHEFKRMTGHSPASLFRSAATPAYRRLNAVLATSGFFNTLIT